MRRLTGAFVLAVCAATAHSQTLERFAGGRTVDNLPALEAPVTTGAIVTMVDGTAYVVDTHRHRLMRRDPVTSMLTVFPSATAGAPWDQVHNVFRSATLISYLYAGGALYRLYLPSGQIELVTRLDNGSAACNSASYSAQFAADWNGNVYFTDPDHKQRLQGARLQFHPAFRGRRYRGIRGRWRAGRTRSFQQPIRPRHRLRKQHLHRRLRQQSHPQDQRLQASSPRSPATALRHTPART